MLLLLDTCKMPLLEFSALATGEKGDRTPQDLGDGRLSEDGRLNAAEPAEDAAPLEVPDGPAFAEPRAVERRLWRNILAVVAFATVAAAIFGDLRFMLGLVLGGTLALLNYRWLHSSLRAILDTGSSSAPPGTSVKFIVRWLLIAVAAWAANQTGYFDPVGILAGLFAPALAVMFEAAYSTYKTLTRHDGER